MAPVIGVRAASKASSAESPSAWQPTHPKRITSSAPMGARDVEHRRDDVRDVAVGQPGMERQAQQATIVLVRDGESVRCVTVLVTVVGVQVNRDEVRSEERRGGEEWR